jgi:hypothetical protein
MTQQTLLCRPSTFQIEQSIETMPQEVWHVHGQVTPYDRLLYYWCARYAYTGNGTIVDGGALVGATTTALGEGLKANEKAKNKAKSILVYDLFEDAQDGYSAQTIRQWYGEQRQAHPIYDFEKHFRSNTRAYSEMLVVHRGDISALGYRDPRPIEILSVDVAKTPELMRAMARDFFPKLITNASMVLHQDYQFVFQPWLHIAMEMLAAYFEKVYEVPTQCTAVFVPKKEISAEEIISILGREGPSFYKLENAYFLHQAIEKAESTLGKILLTGALAYFHLVMGKRITADYIARRLLDQFDVSRALIERTELKILFQNELNIQIP